MVNQSVAPISFCLICKDEGPRLAACLESVRPYCAELIVIDTGSTDNSEEIAKRYTDRWERFTDCNDSEGRINDFSLARQRSFDLATQPWIAWLDCDDTLAGGGKLAGIIEEMEAVRSGRGIMLLFPYEYFTDADGNVRVLQYRERIFTNDKSFSWINRIHEVCSPLPGSNVLSITRDDVVWKHNRADKVIEGGRNLRIMNQVMEDMESGKIPEDARQYYYCMLERFNNNDPSGALQVGSKYLALTGWDDEFCMASYRIGQHYMSVGDYKSVIDVCFKAVSRQEKWCESYIMMSKAFYLLATLNKDTQRNYERCIHFAQLGLSYPPTKTLLFIDPMERSFEIHKFLNVALSRLGRTEEALASCEEGLKIVPTDPWLLCNRVIYQKHISRIAINLQLDKMLRTTSISQQQYDGTMAVLEGEVQGPTGWAPFHRSPNFPKDIAPDSFIAAKKTPHAQAWGIPEEWYLDDFPINMTDLQLQSAVLLIWKEFLLHDEVLSARSFLENAPTRVRHTRPTEKALADTKKMVDWIDNLTTATIHNSPEDTTIEIGMPLPYDLVAQQGCRYSMVAERLPSKQKIIDFGCFDGAFTNRYGLAGHEVIGLDLVQSSIDMANKKAIEWNTGAKHIRTYFEEAESLVPSNYFDVATSTDTYEHLRKPVEEMLKPAFNMLKPDGKFLLCTPKGSWMQGVFPPPLWAHPWVECVKNGVHWNAPVPHGHLIAPTAWSTAKDLAAAGFYVYDCFPVETTPQDVPGQGNIFAEARKLHPIADGEVMDVVFFMGDGLEWMTPEYIKKKGSGASESLLADISKRIAASGHRVRVYAGVGPHGEGIYNGVEWYQTDKFQDLTCDVLVVSRRADMLSDAYNIKSNLKLLWCHDVVAVNASNNLLLNADRILALTDWHKQYLMNAHNLHSDHVLVTRNGIDLNHFKKDVVRNPFKVVNCSSPDRSYKVLLECWKDIKAQVPEAELHLFYGLNNMRIMAQWNANTAAELATLEKLIENVKDQGVVHHGRISQEALAEELLSASVWAYPNWFEETYSVAAASAQAAGLRIVCSANAALNEVVADRGVRIGGDSNSVEYKRKFVEEVVIAIRKEGNEDRLANQKYADEHFGLDSLATDWIKMFKDLQEEKKSHPIVPYISVPE